MSFLWGRTMFSSGLPGSVEADGPWAKGIPQSRGCGVIWWVERASWRQPSIYSSCWLLWAIKVMGSADYWPLLYQPFASLAPLFSNWAYFWVRKVFVDQWRPERPLLNFVSLRKFSFGFHVWFLWWHPWWFVLCPSHCHVSPAEPYFYFFVVSLKPNLLHLPLGRAS